MVLLSTMICTAAGGDGGPPTAQVVCDLRSLMFLNSQFNKLEHPRTHLNVSMKYSLPNITIFEY